MATKKTSKSAKLDPASVQSNGYHAENPKIQPILNQRGPIIQDAGTVRDLPIGLEAQKRLQIVEALNQILIDTTMITALYKKHHWQVSGPTFYQLHLLFDKHYEEQSTLIDTIAERIQLLGGVSTSMPSIVAEKTRIEEPPSGVEEVPVQVSRLLEAHEIIVTQARELADKASELGDEGTNDMLISDVVRINEMQTWFVASHLAPESLVKASQN